MVEEEQLRGGEGRGGGKKGGGKGEGRGSSQQSVLGSLSVCIAQPSSTACTPGCADNGPGTELTQAKLRPVAVLPVA